MLRRALLTHHDVDPELSTGQTHKKFALVFFSQLYEIDFTENHNWHALPLEAVNALNQEFVICPKSIKFGQANRQELNQLLLSKLSDDLDEETRLQQSLSKNEGARGCRLIGLS